MGIEFNMDLRSDDDAATRDPRGVTLKALRDAITKIEATNHTLGCNGVLKDVNGNSIGTFDLTIEPEDDADPDAEDEDD